MADVALYFDGSGFGGTAGPEDDWAAVVAWQAGLGEDQYPALGHLIVNGWEDDLPALETDIEGAMKDNPPPDTAKGSLEEFLSVLKDRAEGDSAVAITLNEEGVVGNAMRMEGSDRLTPSDFAYVPDPSDHTTWKLRIDDARHVAAACAAIGKGFRGQKVDIPATAMPGVKKKIRAAWHKFFPDKEDSEMPEVIRNEAVTLDESVTLDDAPLFNARKPSRMLDISPEKACQILKDGTVRGKELTARQRGLFGVICGRRGKKPTGNSAEDFDPEQLDYELALDELSLMAQDGELPVEEFVGNESADDGLGDVAVNLMDPVPQTEPYGTPMQYTIPPSAYTTGVKGADEASGRARVDSHLAMDKAGHRAAAKSHLKAAMAHLDGAQNVVAGTGSMSMPQLGAHLDAARQHINAARTHAGNCATSADSTQNQSDSDFELEISPATGL